MEASFKELKMIIETDLRDDLLVELANLRQENLRLSSSDKDELINKQQIQIQDLKEDLYNVLSRIRSLEVEAYNSKNRLEKNNCTEFIDAEILARKQQNNDLLSLIDAINAKPR